MGVRPFPGTLARGTAPPSVRLAVRLAVRLPVRLPVRKGEAFYAS
ncbi:hypothetical protein [Streptomyces sp. NPDC050504]